jgi:K+/H+ antiporter YhaU regulatory subunit KhtT
MTELKGDSGRDTIDVHNRLDKVVLALTQHDGACATTTLTATDARQLAQALGEAADAAERTPAS